MGAVASSSRNDSLQRLAAVELQLIMHGLECKELLRFARCSRRLLAAADTPLAWKHVPFLEFRIVWDYPLPTCNNFLCSLPSVSRSRLLRHARSSLFMDLSEDEEVWSARIDLAHRVAEVTRVESLHDVSFWLPAEHWTYLLKHPAMQSLRLLICNFPVVELLQLVGSLPHLRGLCIPGFGHMQDNPVLTAAYAPLLSFPSLTALSLRDSHDEKFSPLPIVAQCHSLHSLSILFPRLHGAAFRAFFTAPVMAQLRSLTLFGLFGLESVRDADFPRALAALHSLIRLVVSPNQTIDRLVAHLHHAPVLRSFIFAMAREDFVCPSATAILSLLRRVPHLRIEYFTGDRRSQLVTNEGWADLLDGGPHPTRPSWRRGVVCRSARCF